MNTGLISIGTGGTGGHSTLLRKINSIVSEFSQTYLISEYDCSAKNKDLKLIHIPITRRSHQESLAGRLVHESYGEIISAIKNHNIDNLVFSTFFDERILNYAKQEGIRTTLVTYPIRDSFAEYFILKGFDSKFDNVIVLNDVAGTENYFKSKNSTVAAYIPGQTQGQPTPEERKNTVMVQCGGGGRPSSKTFLEKVDKVLARFEKELPEYHFLISTGIYGSNNYTQRENCTILSWIDNWQNEIKKAKAAISEAGYFAMHELIYTKTPAVLIPGARRTDNQELRAVKYEEKGMGLAIMPQHSEEELFEAVKYVLDSRNTKKIERNCDKYIRNNLELPSLNEILKEKMEMKK